MVALIAGVSESQLSIGRRKRKLIVLDNLLPSEAVHGVVVDHPRGLHVGVADG